MDARTCVIINSRVFLFLVSQVEALLNGKEVWFYCGVQKINFFKFTHPNTSKLVFKDLSKGVPFDAIPTPTPYILARQRHGLSGFPRSENRNKILPLHGS